MLMNMHDKNIIRTELRKPCASLLDISLNLPALPPDSLNVNFSNNVPEESKIQNGNPFPFSISDVFETEVLKATCLTSGAEVKKIIEICLHVKDASIKFVPGDTIGIIPCNLDSEVDEILQHLGYVANADHQCIIEVIKQETSKRKPSIPQHIPCDSSLRHILKTCVDLRSIPKKAFLRVLAEHTRDSEERRRLEELCSRQGASEYSKHVLEAGANLLDIFSSFPSCKPPVARLLEHLPRLQARPYSVTSSPLAHPTSVKIVFSVVKHGLCSTWLENTLLQEDIRVPMFFRKSTGFTLPSDPTVPLILIGPGTGVAPFLGFLEHRSILSRNSEKLGEVWLFFGCRHSSKDFIYRSELEQYLESGVLTQLFTSFSRDDLSNGQPKYVQDNIRRHSKEFIKQFLEKESVLYVCGDARSMAKDVQETIVNVIQTEQGLPENSARAVVTDLQKSGRYLQDIWM